LAIVDRLWTSAILLARPPRPAPPHLRPGTRIRDKIAASKRKGLWMGGFVPLGYDAKDRSLVINEPEAEIVRTVFRPYLEHGNVRRVKAEADRLGLATKIRKTEIGRMRGGRPLSRGYIYKLLGNPIYFGRIAHKGEVCKGLHEAIIDAETWEAVQSRLASNAHDRRPLPLLREPGRAFAANRTGNSNSALFFCDIKNLSWRCRQSRANPSLESGYRNSLLNREKAGNSYEFGQFCGIPSGIYPSNQ
jgi:hypothetical protein